MNARRRRAAAPVVADARGLVPAGDARAALVLAATLAALAIARASLAFVAGTWGWGLASLAFVPAAPAWTLWALALLALLPPVGRPLSRALAALGDALVAAPARAWAAHALLALTAAASVLALEDRGGLVGDFALRSGMAHSVLPYAQVFPQAFPLDEALHRTWPAALARLSHLDAAAAERALGAVRAAALAIAGGALARASGRGGAAAGAIAIAAVAQGALGLCTGYAKGLAEVALLATCAAAPTLAIARGRGGLGWLSLWTALALLVHRSGAMLLAPWAVGAALALRRGATTPARPWERVASALPPLALASVAAQAARQFAGIDREHLAPGGAGAIAARAFATVHLADVGNIVHLVAPLALAATVAAVFLRPRPRGAVTLALAAQVLPALAVLLLVHPRQGMVRDWDVFAPAGAALACAAAAIAGAALARAGTRAWLAAAVALGAIAPTGSLLLRAHDPAATLAFARAAIAGPPARAAAEVANLEQYVGLSLAQSGDAAGAARALGDAARAAPSPSYLDLWYRAAVAANDLDAIRDATAALAARAGGARQYLALSQVERLRGDVAAARAAALRAMRAAPGDSACDAWARSLGLSPSDTAASLAR